MNRNNSRVKIAVFVKKTLTILMLLFTIVQTYAQDEVTEKNPFIYTKNSFAISMGSGFNQTQFTASNDDDKPRPGIGLIPRLNFDYRFSLGDHFGLSLGTGLGAFPFRFKVDDNGDFGGTEGWSYLQHTSYHLFTDLKFGLDYNIWLNRRLTLKTTFGGGLLNAIESLNSNIGLNASGYVYAFEYFYDGASKPYTFFSSQIERVLENDDLIGLSLSYEHFFSSIYEGDYQLFNGESKGTLINQGNNIRLSLAYTFTRARKLKFTEDIFVNDDNGNFKEAKKTYKNERRYINPESTFFNVSSGLFFARNNVGFGEHLLKSGSSPAWIFSANMEKGIKNNHFWQAGLSISESRSVIKLNRPIVSGESASSEFVAIQTSFGFGTRLISQKSNINYLNVSAGLTLGVHPNQKGQSGHSEGTGSSNSELLYAYRVTYSVKRNIYPTLYLNFSRDFQLAKNIYFSLDYRFNLGFMNVVGGDVELMEQPDFSNVLTDQININGTSNAFQIGVKYKLVPRSK